MHNFNGERMTDIGIYDVNYLDLDLYFQWQLQEKKTNIDIYGE